MKINRITHILNPKAGKGLAQKIMNKIRRGDDSIHTSQSPDEVLPVILSECAKDPETCITVYGGDGTVYGAVNALMNSGFNRTATLRVIPAGSGNDFVRSFPKNGEYDIDLIRYNGKFCANMLNIGFDCSVVTQALRYKKWPLVGGGASYILGVVHMLAHRKPLVTAITLTYADGSVEEIPESEYLLIAIGNGQWCGGGFKAASAAKVDDGLLDVLIVKNVSNATFISLVGDYRKGTHVDSEGVPLEKFRKFLSYKKCVSIRLSHIDEICADGEIFPDKTLEACVMPHAVHYYHCPTEKDDAMETVAD